MGNDFLGELRWRGLLYQRSAEHELDAHLATTGRLGYCGFDPTADSLTIGNLVPIMLLLHWQRAGHRPIVVMGGGTGLVGDPSGKDQERRFLSPEQVEANIQSQRRIFERFLDFDERAANPAVVVNNAEWLQELRVLEFLRDVGKHFSVNAMIQKDSVRERLNHRDQGISYTEFSYMLLQAYDFMHLRRTMDCTVQMAGSDQYGNITAGIDLIHRALGHRTDAFGITAPLVTHDDGRKIGKSEGGALWLSADRSSPYAFYQYWVNVPDDDIALLLRRFTLLDREEIEGIEASHASAPEDRLGQRALAREITERLHGVDELRRVESASDALFGRGDLTDLDEATLGEVSAELPHSEQDARVLLGEGVSLVDILAATTLATSKREARELLDRGAIWVNGKKIDRKRRLSQGDLLPGGVIFFRRGRKQWHVIRFGSIARGYVPHGGATG